MTVDGYGVGGLTAEIAEGMREMTARTVMVQGDLPLRSQRGVLVLSARGGRIL